MAKVTDRTEGINNMENDLISRQAAIDAVSAVCQDNRAISFITAIKEVPSAQPEIVRCKDCKWGDWYTSVDGKRYCYCMETGASGRTADDFCSYAEREEA